MNCPEVIVFSNDYFNWTRYGRVDYKSRRAPLIERLNIFRYSLLVRYPGGRLIINREGKAWRPISNFLYRLKVATCHHDFADRVYCRKCFQGKPETTLSKGDINVEEERARLDGLDLYDK